MSVYEKLIRVQEELKAPKNQMNKFGGYKYRSCEDILEAVKPILSKNKATIYVFDSVECVDGWHYIKAVATFVDCENGDNIMCCAYAREEEIKKGMDASQITGSASSYARKYALNGLLLIDDTKDADATNDHGKDASNSKNSAPKTDESESLKKVLGDIKKDNTTTEIKPKTSAMTSEQKQSLLTDAQKRAINLVVDGQKLGDMFKNNREKYEAIRPVASKLVKDAMTIIDEMAGVKNG